MLASNPRRNRPARAIGAAVFTLALQLAAQTNDVPRICSDAVTVPFDEAVRAIVSKVQPDIPPLAKQMHIQGTVRIEVCVSQTGEVFSLTPMGGSPLLVPAALEAVKKWRFQPRMKGDSTVPFKTVVEMPFSLGSTPAEIQDEERASSQYFEAEGRCRASLEAHKLNDAAKHCQKSIDLADRLPMERANERRLAYSFTGQAFFEQRKFDTALGFYQHELDIAVRSLKPDEAELAYAHHDVALAFHAMGDTKQAQGHYEQAEAILQLAREHIGLAELKPKYAKTMEHIRRDYLILLQQTGQSALAAEVENRLKTEP
jgi:TonB family protein